MTLNMLDTVVLAKDLPEHGLKVGDLGAVVHVHPDGEVEVEFVSAAGTTLALVELTPSDVRHVDDQDLISVRQLRAAG